MSTDNIDTARTVFIGAAGTSWSFFGMPLSEVAALSTAVYIVLKIILILPELKKKYWKPK